MGGEAGGEVGGERSAAARRRGASRRYGTAAAVPWALAAVSTHALGCDPVIDVAGSFLPAWMPCLAAGAAFAALAHLLLARLGLDPHLGPRPLIYACLAALGTMTTWLVFFRP